jgi:membrane protein DedA with SNARE-associated domain
MVEYLLSFLAHIAITLISSLGYFGTALAMAIESANIPLPSEIIMPFSGFLVSTGRFTFWGVVIAGALGGTTGSILSYALGYYGGETAVRHLIRNYGKYLLIFEYELDEAEHWFKRHGQLVTFTARLFPVIRTFISLPAGMSKMDVKKFAFFAFLGTFVWSIPLTYLGKTLGENWETLGVYFRKFDYLVLIIGIAGVAFYVYHKLKKHRRWQSKQSSKKSS